MAHLPPFEISIDVTPVTHGDELCVIVMVHTMDVVNGIASGGPRMSSNIPAPSLDTKQLATAIVHAMQGDRSAQSTCTLKVSVSDGKERVELQSKMHAELLTIRSTFELARRLLDVIKAIG